MHLAHAAPVRAPGSAHHHLEGSSSWESGWLLSTPAYTGGRGGNGSPCPEHLQVELWCRALLEEGGLVLGLWARKGMSLLPAHPRNITAVGRSGRQMGGWVRQCSSALIIQVSLPPASEACFPLPSPSCPISQEVLEERTPHVPSVTSSAHGCNVPAVKH